MNCKQCNGDSRCCPYDDHEKTDLCDKKIKRVEFQKWFDSYYPNGAVGVLAQNTYLQCWQAAQNSKQIEINALNARIAELEKQNQWQPIETAPRDCIIQIKTSDNKVYAGCYNPNGTKWTWCLIYGAKQTPDSSDEELAFDYETVKERGAMQWKHLQ